MKQKILCVLAMIFFASLAIDAAERPLKRHAPAKTYVCQEPGCGRVCTQKNALDIHMRTHTGEKPFACDTCGRKFSQNCNRTRHQNICTGLAVPKEFSCKQCTKTYSSRWTLANHITIKHARNRTPSPEPVVAPPPAPAVLHVPPVVPEIVIAIEEESAQKNLVCRSCDTKFIYQNAFRFHVLGCAPKAPVQEQPQQADRLLSCTQCKITYYRAWQLANHIAIAHERNRTPSPELVVAPRPAPAALNMLPAVPQMIIAAEEEEKEKTFLRSESAGAMLSAEPLEDYE